MKLDKPSTALNGLQRFIEAVRGIVSPMEKSVLRKMRKQSRAYKRFWHHSTYSHSGKRQSERYLRNDMVGQQQRSHKPPAIWPLHLGPSPYAASASEAAR